MEYERAVEMEELRIQVAAEAVEEERKHCIVVEQEVAFVDQVMWKTHRGRLASRRMHCMQIADCSGC